MQVSLSSSQVGFQSLQCTIFNMSLQKSIVNFAWRWHRDTTRKANPIFIFNLTVFLHRKRNQIRHGLLEMNTASTFFYRKRKRVYRIRHGHYWKFENKQSDWKRLNIGCESIILSILSSIRTTKKWLVFICQLRSPGEIWQPRLVLDPRSSEEPKEELRVTIGGSRASGESEIFKATHLSQMEEMTRLYKKKYKLAY